VDRALYSDKLMNEVVRSNRSALLSALDNLSSEEWQELLRDALYSPQRLQANLHLGQTADVQSFIAVLMQDLSASTKDRVGGALCQELATIEGIRKQATRRAVTLDVLGYIGFAELPVDAEVLFDFLKDRSPAVRGRAGWILCTREQTEEQRRRWLKVDLTAFPELAGPAAVALGTWNPEGASRAIALLPEEERELVEHHALIVHREQVEEIGRRISEETTEVAQEFLDEESLVLAGMK
jgi:hypothetical protein